MRLTIGLGQGRWPAFRERKDFVTLTIATQECPSPHREPWRERRHAPSSRKHDLAASIMYVHATDPGSKKP